MRTGVDHDGDETLPAVPAPAVPVSDFTTAAAATLKRLHARVGLETWAVARRDGDDYVVLSALDGAGVGMDAGDVMAWGDTFCGAVVAGRAPRFSTAVEQEEGWAHALRATGFPWRSYVSVPLTGPDGTVLGTLCAGAREAVDPAVALQLPDVELAADLLATVLSYELRLEQEARRAEQAEAVAERDALTGVGNRRAWDNALAAEEARARRLGSTASVLVVDLDGLKELNDTRGHEAGDALIVQTAQVLRAHLRPGDLLARLGGDEFAALLPGAHRAATATVLGRLRGGLTGAGVRASLGAATRRAATGLDTAWREADAAMYADKAARAGQAAARAAARALGGAATALRLAGGAGPGDLPGTAPQPVGDAALNARIDRLLDVARRQLGMDAAVLAEFSGDTWTLRHTATAAGVGDPRGFSTDRGDTYCQRVLEGYLDPVVADARTHPATSALPITAALDIGAYVGVPVLLDDGSVYGTLCALSTTAQPGLRGRDAGVLEIIAEALGELVTHEQQQARQRRAVLNRLDELHRDGGPRPVYQPVCELDGLRPVGHEALSRFPVGAPDTWFADAARVGSGERLELAAVRAALAQRPAGEGFLSLNVSPALATSPALARALEGERLGTLVLEITEHEAVADYPALLRRLAPLREAGLRVAVDDAGAGFASMRHVLALEPDFIKLDMSLIRGIHLDGTRRALAASLTTFAHQTGALVVAEGIEDVRELHCLRGLGVSHGQGYHLGRPAPPGAAAP
ncbi:bifunctional diguanylate cyclase/phosphodiesterase [Kineococcus sp. SYSU DK002]|uniref:bifunctional diguanylate cyclase/phosphodiesterase n=1 Tax=Kineococcus sp. SYSU DK002 TaxID=3383123 RepID=UPI003D7D4C99